MNRGFIDSVAVVQAIAPKDATGAAQTGAAVSLKGYERVAVVINVGTLTGSDAMTVTLAQATDIAFGTTKALTFARFRKNGVVVASGTLTVANTDSNAQYVIEVPAQQLDVQNGYDCLRVAVSSPGAHASLISANYLMLNGRLGLAVDATAD